MKKHVVLATFVSLLTAVGVPSALSAGPGITPANGNDVVLPDGSVYQLNDDGSYSWIPDVATANAMGVDWNSLQPVAALDGPEGDPFPPVLVLTNASVNVLGTSAAVAKPAVAKANGNDVILPDGSIYQRNDDGSYSWIPDVATANAMGVDWNGLEAVDSLDGPEGDPFPKV